MELVNHFNAELQSLYDSKPPISKGKMTSVTKGALKAVKFYKHVVQSVEKFIQKCKSEYKIPGLYVIDSIIRQSRHQYGPDKDMFAPRFARNLQTTFAHLYKCPEDEKAKIIRVLNLWQKNRIFTPEVIQPLFDLADPNNPIWETIQLQRQDVHVSQNNANSTSVSASGNATQAPLPPLLSDQIQFKKELLDYDYEEDEGDDRNKGQQQAPAMSSSNNEFTATSLPANFEALGSILTNPEVLRQLQTLQEQMAAAAAQQHHQVVLTPEQERQRKLAELNKQEAAFDQRLAQTIGTGKLPFAVDFSDDQQQNSPNNENYLQQFGGIDQNSNQLSNHQTQQLLPPPFLQQLNQMQEHHRLLSQSSNDNLNIPSAQNPFGIPLTFPIHGVPPAFSEKEQNARNFTGYNQEEQESNNPFMQYQPPASLFDQNVDDEKEQGRHESRDRRKRRSRTPDRRGGRSGTPSRNRRRSRSTSRNRSRKRYRSRSRSRDRRERERERDRIRKGFPPPQREQLSVCSTTLWVGHLSRQVSQEEISDTFGPYGDIISIDLIPPRGCAFVVMDRRQDATRALDRLKNTKLQGKTITLAWAPGKGVKGRDWKDYWEVDTGVSYIPWTKLSNETDLEEFEDGGCVDEDTLPDYLKNKPRVPKPPTVKNAPTEESSKASTTETETKSNTAAVTLAVNDQPKNGDIDARQDLAQTSLAAQTPAPVPPPMISSAFGLPTSVGLGMMAPPLTLNSLNMMIPPPLLGQMGVAPPFTPMGFPMMGVMPTNLNTGLHGDPTQMKPGLLGEIPLQNLQHMNHNTGMMAGTGPSGIEEGERQEEEDNRKRDLEPRENRERKRSRFDDANNRNSPAGAADMEETHSPSMNERPLFERLKTLAEGYQFGSSAGQDKNSLLGAPIGPPLRPGLPSPRGFPRGGGQFPGPRQPWLDNRDGQRPWFDSPQSQNPFINPNPGQNPFAQGNPFVQTANNSENPFEIAAVAGQRPEGFFGAHPRGRGGWPRGDGGGPWRGDRGRGRGGMRGSSRDGGNWHNRRMEEEMHGGADRGFRGRGRGMGRGRGDFDRGRRRDWGEREDGVRDGNRERERKLSRESENSTMNFSQSQPSTGFDENWEEQRNENATGNHANSEFGNNSINNPADEVWDEPEFMSTSDAAHNDQPDYNEVSWVDNNAESSDAFKNSTNENWQEEANHANHDNSPLTNNLASNNVNDICEGEFEDRSMDSNIYENVNNNGNDVTSDCAGSWNTEHTHEQKELNNPTTNEVNNDHSETFNDYGQAEMKQQNCVPPQQQLPEFESPNCSSPAVIVNSEPEEGTTDIATDN